MRVFRNATCDKCFEDFNYLYLGGRTRKSCPNCKPKKRKRKQQCDAYAFNWGSLPYPWRNTKSSGNPTRWIGKHRLVLSATNGRFALGILLMGNWHSRSSTIEVKETNISQALAWSEVRARSIVDSFETF